MKEVGSAVLQADDALSARMRDGRGANRGEGLDHTAMHAAVHDAVALKVLFAHLPFAAHLFLRGGENHDPHLLYPARHGVDPGDEFFAHRSFLVFMFRMRTPQTGRRDPAWSRSGSSQVTRPIAGK